MEYVLEENHIKWYRRLDEIPDRIQTISEIYLPEIEQMVWIDYKDYLKLEELGEI